MKAVSLVFRRSRDWQPIATLANDLPRATTDLSPAELRLLASVFLVAAEECEKLPMEKLTYAPKEQTYFLVDAKECEKLPMEKLTYAPKEQTYHC